jgi:hypothetical protein
VPSPKPPRFEKHNQHYVPQFWLGGFAGANGRLHGLLDGVYENQVAANDIMSDAWIYTSFDGWWRPSDDIEDDLGAIDTDASTLFNALQATLAAPTDEQWERLCFFLALASCRHVDTMFRGHERAKEMALALGDPSAYDDERAFLADMKTRFGADIPSGLWHILKAKEGAALTEEVMEVLALQTYDPKLPMQLSLLATDIVNRAIAVQDLWLLDAPGRLAYVLGDHPVALHSLGAGFDVPLSSRLAFRASPAAPHTTAVRGRRPATPSEVRNINLNQKSRTRSVLVGNDRALLEGLLLRRSAT